MIATILSTVYFHSNLSIPLQSVPLKKFFKARKSFKREVINVDFYITITGPFSLTPKSILLLGFMMEPACDGDKSASKEGIELNVLIKSKLDEVINSKAERVDNAISLNCNN